MLTVERCCSNEPRPRAGWVGVLRLMASFNPQDFGFDEPPPRPTTPPVRRGFLLVLFVLSLAALVVYGVPYVAERTGYAWESGRARADIGSPGASSTRPESSIARPPCFAWRRRPFRRRSSTCNRFERGAEAKGFRACPLGGNRMTPGFQSSELGSGVIIDKAKGYVVTNNHVVKDADRIMVRLGPGDEVRARLVGADPKSDLAVLQIKADLKVQAEWGDSDQLDIGDWVLAIGSPLGFDHSVTAGIVSATERNGLRISEYESFIQTDAAINPGNSGGPLVNLAGKVVGINTAIITQSGGYEGIGLAIPSSQARRVVESLIKDGKVVRGYLGVRLDLRPLDTATGQEAQASQQPRCSGRGGSARQPGRAGRAEGRRRDRQDRRSRRRRPCRTEKSDRRPGCRRPGSSDLLSRRQAADGHRHHRRTTRRPEVLASLGFRSASARPTKRVAGPTSRSIG